MVQKYISVKTSDLSGAEIQDGDGETIMFSVGKSSYVIDLTDEEAGGFYDALKPYTDTARRDSAASANTKARSAGPKHDLAAIRQWANANGHPVSSRGRIPGTIIDAYESAR